MLIGALRGGQENVDCGEREKYGGSGDLVGLP